MSVPESVRGVVSRMDDMMAVSEEPLVQHMFNPTPRFYVLMIIFNVVVSLFALFFPALGTLGVATILVSCLFLITRFCSGYRVSPALMWSTIGLAVFSAMMMSCVTYYAAIHAANSDEAKTAVIAVTVLGALTLIPYLIISSMILRKFRDLALLQAAPAMTVVMPPTQNDAPAAAGAQSYPVDIAQSDGAAVIQV